MCRGVDQDGLRHFDLLGSLLESRNLGRRMKNLREKLRAFFFLVLPLWLRPNEKEERKERVECIIKWELEGEMISNLMEMA